jgi:hypothetical protein
MLPWNGEVVVILGEVSGAKSVVMTKRSRWWCVQRREMGRPEERGGRVTKARNNRWYYRQQEGGRRARSIKQDVE